MSVINFHSLMGMALPGVGSPAWKGASANTFIRELLVIFHPDDRTDLIMIFDVICRNPL